MQREQQSLQFETKAIHTGYASHDHHDSLVTPVYQTSTYTFSSLEQGARRFAGEEEGYMYSRLGNPTVTTLEERMAALEGGEAALAFSSGMAAVSAVLVGLTKAGDHIVVSKGVYGCTFGLLEMLKEKYEVDYTFSDLKTVEEIEAAICENTVCIYVETPINPTMRLIDLCQVVRVAKEKAIKVVVDNTFASPYLQQPLALGCDFVVHSATKYICGHGDVVAGILVGDEASLQIMKKTVQKDMGGIIAPFDAWLLLRGLKTLAVRMERHCDNAKVISECLKNHHRVRAVYYPGNDDEDKACQAFTQMKKGGGILSFELNGTDEDITRVVNALQLIKIAVSLGDAETLIQHPASMTHAVVPEKTRQEMGISNGLLRLSVGLECPEDIWADLKQALDLLESQPAFHVINGNQTSSSALKSR